jgi:hypothetical protein
MDLIAFPIVLLAGMWLGDYLGRKYPTQWAIFRMSMKKAGESVTRSGGGGGPQEPK